MSRPASESNFLAGPTTWWSGQETRCRLSLHSEDWPLHLKRELDNWFLLPNLSKMQTFSDNKLRLPVSFCEWALKVVFLTRDCESKTDTELLESPATTFEPSFRSRWTMYDLSRPTEHCTDRWNSLGKTSSNVSLKVIKTRYKTSVRGETK